MGNINEIKSSIGKLSIILPEGTTWKETLLLDLFEIAGKGAEASKDIADGDYNFVSAIDTNNGVERYKSDGTKLFSGGTFTISDFGKCFYQEDNFFGNSHVFVIEPKFECNRNRALFFTTVFNKAFKSVYCFDYTLGLDKFRKITIKLPTKEKEIDWEFIDAFMSDIMTKMECDKIEFYIS